MNSTLFTKKITVIGKVQGVYFRQSTREKALELGLAGTVKNLRSGEVEIVVTGTENQLKEFIDWCHQGPPRAQVREVKVSDLTTELFNGFLIIR